jgi:hypothetical protein
MNAKLYSLFLIFTEHINEEVRSEVRKVSELQKMGQAYSSFI